MTSSKRAWAIGLSAYLVLTLCLYYLFGDWRITIATTLILMKVSLLWTIWPYGESPGGSRSLAMMFSLLPGAAHVYLHQYEKSVMFAAGYVLMIGNVIMMTVHEQYADDMLIISSFFAILFCMLFLSMVDAEHTCNKLEIPYTGIREMKIKNFRTAYAASVLIPSAVVLFTFSYLFLSGFEISADTGTIVMVSWAVASIVCIAGVLALKPSEQRSYPLQPKG